MGEGREGRVRGGEGWRGRDGEGECAAGDEAADVGGGVDGNGISDEDRDAGNEGNVKGNVKGNDHDTGDEVRKSIKTPQLKNATPQVNPQQCAERLTSWRVSFALLETCAS